MTVARLVESNDGSALALATVIIDLSPASRLMALEDTADTAAGAESETTTVPKSTSMPRAYVKVLMAECYQMRHLSVNPASPRIDIRKLQARLKELGAHLPNAGA